jgi:prolipoprotein diacylglyceryltransferase
MYPPFPAAFQVGPLTIHWYGLFMALAIFLYEMIWNLTRLLFLPARFALSCAIVTGQGGGN